MLSADKYTRLLLELQYMPGSRLADSTIDNITAFLESICHKPAGIEIEQTEISISAPTLSLDNVRTMEKKYRTTYTTGKTMIIYGLITDGHSDSSLIAAYSYHNTSFVVYGKVIKDDVAHVGRVHLETFLLMHELGHLMGLTNKGAPMQQPHEDSVVMHHCTNHNCTMYYGTVSTQLDSNCLRDLRANGGK